MKFWDRLWTFFMARLFKGDTNHYHRGMHCENRARLYLKAKGYRCLKKRYITPLGEIDLLMAKGSTLIAVEVKYRATHDQAAYAITPRQQYRIRRSLEQAHKQFPNFLHLRCDSILIFEDKWPIHMINVF